MLWMCSLNEQGNPVDSGYCNLHFWDPAVWLVPSFKTDWNLDCFVLSPHQSRFIILSLVHVKLPIRDELLLL